MRHLLNPAFLGLCLSLCGCSAYQVGPSTLFPAEVRTVYVPIFESESFRRHLGERLTEAVAKEIENRTPYKVVADPNADSMLVGRIVGEQKRLVLNTLAGDPRELQLNLKVEVAWLDRRGRALREAWQCPLPREITFVDGSEYLVPEMGQSVATQHQEAIEEVARQIVNLMEAPW
ncbi:MAG: LPS assembly lipoprotein LptE [Planctomycetota bacterium]